MRFYPLEKLINLHDDYRRQFKIDHLQLMLIQRRGERYVFESHCPHRAHPLETAAIENGVIRCPLHQYEFSLDDGKADIVVVRFGDKYKQWNAAFDAGMCAALGKPYITLHDESIVHPLKEVDGAAMAWAQNVPQVIEMLAYVTSAE